jgi:hypothetical protein
MTPNDLLIMFQNLPDPPMVFYRLYHDSHGNPLFYSMEDVPGTYVDIDRETYVKCNMHVRVVDSQVIEVTWKTTNKIVPSIAGVACDPHNAAVVVDSSKPNKKWSKKTYESY